MNVYVRLSHIIKITYLLTYLNKGYIATPKRGNKGKNI